MNLWVMLDEIFDLFIVEFMVDIIFHKRDFL